MLLENNDESSVMHGSPAPKHEGNEPTHAHLVPAVACIQLPTNCCNGTPGMLSCCAAAIVCLDHLEVRQQHWVQPLPYGRMCLCERHACVQVNGMPATSIARRRTQSLHDVLCSLGCIASALWPLGTTYQVWVVTITPLQGLEELLRRQLWSRAHGQQLQHQHKPYTWVRWASEVPLLCAHTQVSYLTQPCWVHIMHCCTQARSSVSCHKQVLRVRMASAFELLLAESICGKMPVSGNW